MTSDNRSALEALAKQAIEARNEWLEKNPGDAVGGMVAAIELAARLQPARVPEAERIDRLGLTGGVANVGDWSVEVRPGVFRIFSEDVARGWNACRDAIHAAPAPEADAKGGACGRDGCGCDEPAFTSPMGALRFLRARFKHAGVSHGVAITYARDIDAILSSHPAPEAPKCDPLGMPECGKPLCTSEDHHPLCSHEPAVVNQQMTTEGREGVEALATAIASDYVPGDPSDGLLPSWTFALHDFARRLAAQPASITGEVVQIGDDEEGQPRIVIHTTREAIRDYPASLLFKRVQVQRTGLRGEVGDA